MSFFEISSSSVSTLLGYVGTLFDNFLPIFLLVIGLAVGFWVFSSLVDTFTANTSWASSPRDDEDFDDEDL